MQQVRSLTECRLVEFDSSQPLKINPLSMTRFFYRFVAAFGR